MSPASPKASSTLGSPTQKEKKHHFLNLPTANYKEAHNQYAHGVVQHPSSPRPGDAQSSEAASRLYRQSAASDTLTPSENKFNIISLFLHYLVSQTPNGETATWAAFHIIQGVCGSQTLFVTGTKGTKRGVFYSEEISHPSWQGTKLSFGGHTVLCKQPGCSC